MAERAKPLPTTSPSSSKSPAWIVIVTQPHRESTALDNLARQGFRSYCPMIKTRVRHARRSSEVLRPLFPGYVFVEVDLEAVSWRPILSTVGVRSVVRFGDQLGKIDAAFIQSLEARGLAGVVERRKFEVGQSVRIAGGAFDNLVATIVETDERRRVVLLMQLLNGEIRVSVDPNDLVCAAAVEK
jgi:transcriptional antiterminator RfaH